MDLFTRKIVGWRAGSRMTKELVIEALEQAYERENPEGGVLHHSDRGSQYASKEYQDKLRAYNMVGSMSRKGNCWDNACIESFHSVIKRELIHLENYTTRAHAQRDIWEYIEIWYNRRRIHSSIGYRTPAQFGASILPIQGTCGVRSMISAKSHSEFSYILCSVCPYY